MVITNDRLDSLTYNCNKFSTFRIVVRYKIINLEDKNTERWRCIFFMSIFISWGKEPLSGKYNVNLAANVIEPNLDSLHGCSIAAAHDVLAALQKNVAPLAKTLVDINR